MLLRVFPARAGVFLVEPGIVLGQHCFPRASGGVSITPQKTGAVGEFSPRERGCFYEGLNISASGTVFPARAGVFPTSIGLKTSYPSFPRASGGVSKKIGKNCEVPKFSPRERGCFFNNDLELSGNFVFPARAGVFPAREIKSWLIDCFPRASGGVSDVVCVVPHAIWFSPRERGCSSHETCVFRSSLVFPARAGVFLEQEQLPWRWFCFPRASGGVSTSPGESRRFLTFSPRERGCFQRVTLHRILAIVFPARAGVFPLWAPCISH